MQTLSDTTVLVIVTIAAGVLLSFGIRYMMMKKRQMQKQRELVEAYNQVKAQNKVVVSHMEIVGNRIIALDRKGKRLVYVEHSGRQRDAVFIALDAFSTIRIVEEKNKQGCIERIVLELKQKSSDQLYRICFFDHAHDAITELTLLARKARHWKNRVATYIHPGIVGRKREFLL